MHKVSRRLAVCVAVVISTSSVRAEEDFPAATEPETPPGVASPAGEVPTTAPLDTLVVAGGVSLGSYQAGFNYYYSRTIHPDNQLDSDNKPIDEPKRLKLVTGASAGSINALLAALASCKKTTLSPEASIFYQTWIPVGVDGEKEIDDLGLVDEDKVTARSLLSTAPIENRIANARAYFEGKLGPDSQWLDSACNVKLGFVVTRLQPRPIVLQTDTNQRVDRQTEKFMLELTHDAKRSAFTAWRPEDPEFAPLRDLYPAFGKAPGELPFWVDEPASAPEQAKGSVGQLLRASASVPFAFPPTPLRFRTCVRKDDSCTEDKPEPYFVDGAVYENVPVRLARRMRTWLPDEETLAGRGVNTVVLDTNTEAWERHVPESMKKPSKEIFTDAYSLIAGVLSSTMGAELLAAFEADSKLRKPPEKEGELAFPRRRAPAASGHFVNFLGFFERDFRVFDFYLGMLDARSFFQHANKSGAAETPKGPYNLKKPTIESKRFACFEEWDDASNGFADFPRAPLPKCQELGVGLFDPDRDKTRWLAKRKVSDCDEKNIEFDELTSEERTSYNLVRLLAASTEFRKWTVSNKYEASPIAQAQEWFDLMTEHDVQLRQIRERAGLKVGKVDPRSVIAETVSRLVPALAKKQSFGPRVALSVLGRAGTNFVYYQEPRHALMLSGRWNRGLDLSYGYAVAPWGFHMRPELGVRFTDLDLRIGEDDFFNEVTATGRARLSFLLAPMLNWSHKSRALFQPELFAGYAAGKRYVHGFKSRTIQRASLGVHLVLIQRIFLDIEVSGCTSEGQCKQRRNSIDKSGQSENALGARYLSFDLGLGWRFLW